MAKTIAKKASNIFVWVILGLLFVALAGFGIGSFSGGASQVAQVGRIEVTAEDYALALQQEIRSRIAQTQTPVSLADLRADRTDEAVLRGLVARAALANEALEMGLSVGDEEVARQITQIQAFQGPDGAFDRDAYEFQIAQLGLDPAEFEQDMREDAARGVLQLAIIGGLQANDTIIETLVAYEMETRDFSLLTITESDLPTGLPAPTDAGLQAHYEANPDRFLRPETRRITYAWVTPTMLMDTITIDEEALRDLYDQRADFYIQPERRLLERLLFLEAEEAQAAVDAIDAGDTDFDTLVADRGLTLEDVNMGEIARGDLSADAAEAIFGDTEAEIIGPVESGLGPAIFRVNAVLEASEVSFEEAQEELRAELAAEAARRAIDDMRDTVDDLLAGGATLEDLAADTDLTLAEIDYTAASDEGIAGYDAFREAADLAQVGDFPELLELSDGGIFALRLDEVVPPALPPLDDIRAEVADAWRASVLRDMLAARGETLVGELAAGETLEDLGRVREETMIRRQDFIPDAPQTLVPQVFQLTEPGDVVMVPGADRAVIARLDAINPAARDQPDAAVLLQYVGQTATQALAADIFEAYGQALEADAGISTNQNVINQVHAQFP